MLPWVHWGGVLVHPKNPRTTILSKYVLPNFTHLYTAVTSCKKIEKFIASGCYNTQKTYLWPLVV